MEEANNVSDQSREGNHTLSDDLVLQAKGSEGTSGDQTSLDCVDQDPLNAECPSVWIDDDVSEMQSACAEPQQVGQRPAQLLQDHNTHTPVSSFENRLTESEELWEYQATHVKQIDISSDDSDDPDLVSLAKLVAARREAQCIIADYEVSSGDSSESYDFAVLEESQESGKSSGDSSEESQNEPAHNLDLDSNLTSKVLSPSEEVEGQATKETQEEMDVENKKEDEISTAAPPEKAQDLCAENSHLTSNEEDRGIKRKREDSDLRALTCAGAKKPRTGEWSLASPLAPFTLISQAVQLVGRRLRDTAERVNRLFY
eukprot:TRINITY_DN3184_c0_g1_i1.p1 TRINITY_DN3184_c0_g1~~TRINITY_DN3184_c0_g1_i1.p1  ORF type:complete len:315 (+),score=43.98 TRINITY_DN3184_c0_g1_i1:329-1273(+)